MTRRFGPVVALDRACFELAPGEIHGVLGENGAGKTTLARVLAGLLAPDEGRVEIAGTPVRLRNAADARERGVAMVHQHFSLVGRFTGFENVALFNREAWTRRGGPVPGYRARIEARAAELGLAADLDVPVERTSVGHRQRIEILKALMTDTRVLLMDEPTAVLAPTEVQGLFAALRRVARSGAGVVLIAHKLDEVMAAADRVTVLRRGQRALEGRTADFAGDELAAAMIGRRARPGNRRDRFSDRFPLESDTPRRDVAGSGGAVRASTGERSADASGRAQADESGGDPRAGADDGGDRAALVASLTDVVAGDPHAPALRGATLLAKRGEVLGVAGVEGNGQRELASVLAGALAPLSGTVEAPDNPGWAPLDRSAEGLVGDFSLAENMALALHDAPECTRGPWIDWTAVRRRTLDALAQMDVAAPGPDALARTLSGGNQQRLLVARELRRSTSLLIAESPTRGLDVNATQAVRRRIAAMVRSGPRPPAVVLISSDLDEILEMSDRIVVMVRGRLLPVPEGDRSADAVGELMLGASDSGARKPDRG